MDPNDILREATEIARKAKQQQAVLDEATRATLKVLIREEIVRNSVLPPQDWDELADYMLEYMSERLGLANKV